MLCRGFEGCVWAVALIAFVLSIGCEIKPATPVSTGGASTSASPAEAKDTTAVANSSTTENSTSPAKAAVADKGESQQVSDTISAEGSSTVYPICQAFAVEFEKKSKHKVSVGRVGTGGGYKRFAIRQADIWNASRPIDDKEATELKSKGIEWIELSIAVDGIVVAVNPQNTWCSEITCAQLKQIWEPDSKVKKWNDVDPSWPSEEISLYGADTDSGTFEYFTEAINGTKKVINTRYTPSSDDNILVQGIASNKYALGFIPFGYYVESTDKLKPLAISPTSKLTDAPAPFVKPTEDSILSREYAPLARSLFMYANEESMKRKEVAEFLRFAVSKAAQPLIAKRGFVRVTDDELKETQKKLEAALSELSGDRKLNSSGDGIEG